MAPTAGFEPVTLRLEGACSIQLSYVGINSNIKEHIHSILVQEILQVFLPKYFLNLKIFHFHIEINFGICYINKAFLQM